MLNIYVICQGIINIQAFFLKLKERCWVLLAELYKCPVYPTRQNLLC